jgi:hypothetical protein
VLWLHSELLIIIAYYPINSKQAASKIRCEKREDSRISKILGKHLQCACSTGSHWQTHTTVKVGYFKDVQ